MDRFIDRQAEINELDQLLNTRKSKFISVYGRRRVGKTTLLLHWARQSGRPYLYWVAKRETPDAVRQSLARAIWTWAYPDLQNPEPPRFDSWEVLFREMVRLIGEKPVTLIFDEFPYAVESDTSFPSHLQAAWDQMLKDKPVILVLSGSHIGMMVDLMASNAPLFGRFTGQFPIEPLPFAALVKFFPKYEAAERVAVYAVLGGIPAYLERFEPDQNLSANIRNHLFQRIGMFRSEPEVLVSELVRETRIYESILRTIVMGANTPAEISKAVGVPSTNLPPYLKRLLELRLIERHIPATVPPFQRPSTTRSHYLVSDPYLRFYFRFIEPNQEMIEQGLRETLWERISEQFRAFVGATTFEELCREWVVAQASARRLPFQPEIVGSHWSPEAQVDVVGMNWREKGILLGECKWGTEAVGRSVVMELLSKAPQVIPGKDWQVTYAFFTRSGFTPEALREGKKVKAIMIDLATLDADLSHSSNIG